MSTQVIRVETFTRGSLGRIGGETERTSKHHRNEDIDDERTPLNYYFKKSESGLTAQWNAVKNHFQADFKETKKSVAFEGIIVTSDKQFFESLGWKQSDGMTPKLMDFFSTAYKFVLKEIGYHGTDENILSAVVHLDETTPHLQLYYVPLVDVTKKKVYEKTPDGKVKRNAKGSPVQAMYENGKSKYEYIELERPKICHSEFWDQRGGQNSYGNLQDDFFTYVSHKYGLGRGEVGSNRKHTTKYEWEMQQQQEKLSELQQTVQAYEQAIDGEIPFLPSDRKKMIVSLRTALEDEKQAKSRMIKDNADLFKLYQKAQKQANQNEFAREVLNLFQEFAPEELKRLKIEAERRKSAKKQPIFPKKKGNFNSH